MEPINTQVIAAAIRFIEENLAEKLDLATVSDAVHYSKYHLHRMFTETVGLTVHDYVRRRQLTEAAKLLVFSEKPILEIAMIAGFESQQAFTAAFTAMYKDAPGQFREKEEFYPLQLEFRLVSKAPILENEDRRINFAKKSDIPTWMELVRLVIDGFPCLIESEYILQLEQAIQEERALTMKYGSLLVGVMVFSYDTGSIDFFGVHPQYRRQGIARDFMDELTSHILPSKDLSITTFREGDRADTGHRKELKKLGFAEAELLIEFGYPTQRMVLRSREEAGELSD